MATSTPRGNLVIALARGLGIIEYMTLEEAEMEGRCRGHSRHWFTRRGSTRDYLPCCWRCGAANPRCPTRVARPMAEYEATAQIGGPATKVVPWRWNPCGRKTDERGYCPEHGPANTYKAEVT